jgi:hypothetical protein
MNLPVARGAEWETFFRDPFRFGQWQSLGGDPGSPRQPFFLVFFGFFRMAGNAQTVHGIRIPHGILQTIRSLGLNGDPGAFSHQGGMAFSAFLDGLGRFGFVSRVAFLAALVTPLSPLVGVMVKDQGFEEHVPVAFRAGCGLVHGLQQVVAFDARFLSPLFPDMAVMVEDNNPTGPVSIDDHRTQPPRSGDGRSLG